MTEVVNTPGLSQNLPIAIDVESHFVLREQIRWMYIWLSSEHM